MRRPFRSTVSHSCYTVFGPFFCIIVNVVTSCHCSSGSWDALKPKPRGRLRWKSLSKVFPFILTEPMPKPVGSSPRFPTTSLSLPHLHGDLHGQQVCCFLWTTRPRDTQSKNSYIRPHHFLISSLLLSFPRPYRTPANSHHSSACSSHGMVLCSVSVNKW